MQRPRIDAGRFLARFEELGAIGATPDGMQRIAFSPAEVRAREWVTRGLESAGFRVRTDACANLIGTRPGSDPGALPLTVGSHVDAVPLGGKYDGALGVVAALEAATALRESGRTTRHPWEVLVFTNEEGARFHRGLMGSRSMAGLLEAGDLSVRDEDGRTLADHLPSVGGDATRLGDAATNKRRVAGYFELHIEQGPILFEEGIQLGIVTGITGRAAATVTVQGFANHAGTTPMERRRDAGAAGARIALAVRDVAARERLCRVGTVGIARLHPGAINVIPGGCTLEVEFRDLQDHAVAAALRRLAEHAAAIAAEERVRVEIEVADRESGTPTDPRFRGFLSRAAGALGYSHKDVQSGASHDAQSMAHLGPMGMLFVPSVNGVSHAVGEFTPPEDCVRGAEVLLEALLLADAELA